MRTATAKWMPDSDSLKNSLGI